MKIVYILKGFAITGYGYYKDKWDIKNTHDKKQVLACKVFRFGKEAVGVYLKETLIGTMHSKLSHPERGIRLKPFLKDFEGKTEIEAILTEDITRTGECGLEVPCDYFLKGEDTVEIRKAFENIETEVNKIGKQRADVSCRKIKIGKVVTGYMLFVRDNSAEITAENPGVSFAQRSQIQGRKWKNIDPKLKKVYEEKAKTEREKNKKVLTRSGKAGKRFKKMDATGGKSPDKKKKVVTGYMLFVRDNSAEITAENPGVSFAQRSKIQGRKWKNIDPKLKKVYEEKAKTEREKNKKVLTRSGETTKSQSTSSGIGKGTGKKSARSSKSNGQLETIDSKSKISGSRKGKGPVKKAACSSKSNGHLEKEKNNQISLSTKKGKGPGQIKGTGSSKSPSQMVQNPVVHDGSGEKALEKAPYTQVKGSNKKPSDGSEGTVAKKVAASEQVQVAEETNASAESQIQHSQVLVDDEAGIILSVKELSQISQQIGNNWQFLGIELGLTKVKLEHLESDNRGNMQMQIYEMLLEWRKKDADEATLCNLQKAMKRCAMVTFQQPQLNDIFIKIKRSSSEN